MDKKIKFLKDYFWFTIKEGSKSNSYFNYENYLRKYPDVRDSGVNPLQHYLLHGIDEGRTETYNKNIAGYHLVEKSELFDFDFYCQENNINFDTYSQGLFHYLEIGYKKGYNPSKKFDGNKYCEIYPKVKEDDWNPLVHYLKFGSDEFTLMNKNIRLEDYQLIKRSQLFDYEFYKKELSLELEDTEDNRIAKEKKDKPDNEKDNEIAKGIDNEIDALEHYLDIGYKKGYNPSKKFDGNNYLKKYFDDYEFNPLLHYLKNGKDEGKTDKCDKNSKEYPLVKESEIFDYEYYCKEYNLDFESYKEGLMHYLEIGFKRGYNPNSNFNGNEYLKKYPEVKKANFNPLVHYLKYGIKEGRKGFNVMTFNNFNENFDVKNILNNIDNETSIIIPIENVENLKKCIPNIIKTSDKFKIYLIETNNYAGDELEEFTQMENIELIRNINSHEDFLKTLNRILENTRNDIIFLKDNVRTFFKWILKLKMAAYSNHRIGFVSPISNYSNMIFRNFENDEKSSEFINNISLKEFNECPLPNDSCVFIKKDVFLELKFDVDEKDEENWFLNFYESALNKGWRSVLDDSIFVYYEYDKIPSEQKDNYNFSTPYNLQNQPNSKFLNSEAFNRTFQNFSRYSDNDLEKNIEEKTKKKILFAMHYGGGVDFTVKDIANSIKEDYDCFVLKSFKNKMILYKAFRNELSIIKEFRLKYSWNPKMLYSEEFAQIYFYILINYNIDILEIDHLLLHTLDLPDIAEKLDIPIILTLHDFYYICPSYFLLDENNKYCGGYCGNQPRNCSTRVLWIDLPANIVEWKNKWQECMKDLFKKCDSIITATNFTKSMFLEHYDSLNEDDISIIEHGRDLIRYDNNYTIPSNYQAIKILIPGVIGPHKGQDFIKELKELDTENRLELHYIGQVDKELGAIGKFHGSYEREDFAKWVYKIKPSFIGIFSVCAETYSHTLTEAICSGVPVLASNLGALKTRIESHGGGWLIDINDTQKAYDQILEISENKEEYKNMTKNLKNIKIPSTEEMGKEYVKIYDELIMKHK